MTDEHELEEEIEQIIERRVEERLKELKSEEMDSNGHSPAGETTGSEPTSRRRVLNTLASGAAGFGLASLLPTASVFNDENQSNVPRYNDRNGTPTFKVSPSGNIDLKGNEITGVGHLNFSDTAVEIGEGASASEDTEGGTGLPRRPIAIGYNAEAGQLNNVSIGNGTESIADDTIAIGAGAQATAENAYAFGEGAFASGDEAIAIGKAAGAEAIGAVALGSNTEDTSGAATARSPYAVAIGADATVSPNINENSIAIGWESSVFEPNSVAIGAKAEAISDAERAVAIGAGTTVETPGVTRIGDGSATNAPDQLVFTAEQDTIADGDLNNGEMTVEMDEANDAFRLRGRDSTGTIREATIPW